jgi:hypothetical protein
VNRLIEMDSIEPALHVEFGSARGGQAGFHIGEEGRELPALHQDGEVFLVIGFLGFRIHELERHLPGKSDALGRVRGAGLLIELEPVSGIERFGRFRLLLFGGLDESELLHEGFGAAGKLAQAFHRNIGGELQPLASRWRKDWQTLQCCESLVERFVVAEALKKQIDGERRVRLWRGGENGEAALRERFDVRIVVRQGSGRDQQIIDRGPGMGIIEEGSELGREGRLGLRIGRLGFGII